MAGGHAPQGEAQGTVKPCALQASGAKSHASPLSGLRWSMPVQHPKELAAQGTGVDAALTALIHAHPVDSEVQRRSGAYLTLIIWHVVVPAQQRSRQWQRAIKATTLQCFAGIDPFCSL